MMPTIDTEHLIRSMRLADLLTLVSMCQEHELTKLATAPTLVDMEACERPTCRIENGTGDNLGCAAEEAR